MAAKSTFHVGSSEKKKTVKRVKPFVRQMC